MLFIITFFLFYDEIVKIIVREWHSSIYFNIKCLLASRIFEKKLLFSLLLMEDGHATVETLDFRSHTPLAVLPLPIHQTVTQQRYFGVAIGGVIYTCEFNTDRQASGIKI